MSQFSNRQASRAVQWLQFESIIPKPKPRLPDEVREVMRLKRSKITRSGPGPVRQWFRAEHLRDDARSLLLTLP